MRETVPWLMDECRVKELWLPNHPIIRQLLEDAHEKIKDWNLVRLIKGTGPPKEEKPSSSLPSFFPYTHIHHRPNAIKIARGVRGGPDA